ncbi:rap1 GTPase-GDP dissociation stimulator 1 [Erpetoichthys calabaricus]|uniref:rap1 GTPase-GDP dissociation stimulator 1 n=1 Tax=Erpetoichthys calabaricus TaxID=27687 RepID=UPI002233E710|nr:rap1 GTPase-GDP dissociation stimulator 1 [Erpetoichthys calabaricus]
MESLSKALETIKNTEWSDNEEHIMEQFEILLTAVKEKPEGAIQLIITSGILPFMAEGLQRNSLICTQGALFIAELAKADAAKKPCVDAGLISALIPLLESSDQELLLHAGRAIGRICFDNNVQQEALVSRGVISRLMGILQQYPENDPLVNVCLLALCNLADLDCAQEALEDVVVGQALIRQLHRANDAERRHIILEILEALSENDVLKLQFVDSGVPEALTEMIKRLQKQSKDSPEAPDLCSISSASKVLVTLLLGDEPMQKCFRDGTGQLYEAILSWLQEDNTDLQRSGALAIANFARNDNNCTRMVAQGAVFQILALLERHVKDGDVAVQHAALSALRNLAIPAANKVQMLEDGLLERIRMLLCSEMPPVQFKLLGMLRMMVDGQEEAAAVLGTDQALLSKITEWCGSQEHAGVRGEANRLLAALIRHSRAPEVVYAVIQANGGKHLISMARSEHVIMQNEALIALAIASAVTIETVEGSFKDGGIVPTLQQMLDDPMVASEVKFSALGLVCSLANSDELREEMIAQGLPENLKNICDHGNAKLASQANVALGILNGTVTDPAS